MISLDLFDYSDGDAVDILVTQYVNDNLAVIIRVLLDYLNSDPDYGMDGLFPRDYLMREPIKCRNHIDELYELIKSPIRRDYLDPKYEYLLYAIIQWWEESNDDEMELIPSPVPDDLIEAILSNPKYQSDDLCNYYLSEIQNYESYYYICFNDHDFLPDETSKMVIIYLRSKNMFERIFPDVELDCYMDLMPVDLREQYIEMREKVIKREDDNINIELQIVKEFYNILRNFQKRIVNFEKRSEPEISDDIRDAAEEPLRSKYNLRIVREHPMGRAVSALGETDLYIFGNHQDPSGHDIDYAIVESKNIDGFLSSFKQLLGYLNQYFCFGITISINRKLNYSDSIKKLKDDLENFHDPDFLLTSVEEISIPQIIKSIHSLPEDKGRTMSVYHMVLDLCDGERKRVAEEARDKRKRNPARRSDKNA